MPRGSLVCTYCVQSLVHCLCSSGHSEVGCYHDLLFRMRKLRSQEGTRLAGVTEPGAWEGAWWAGPLHSVPSPQVTLSAAGMSEDEAAEAPSPSVWEQDPQVRGCTSYGAGHGTGGGQVFLGQLGTPPTSVFARSTPHLGHFGPWGLPSLHLLPASRRGTVSWAGSMSSSTPSWLIWPPPDSPLPALGLCLHLPCLCPPSGHSYQQQQQQQHSQPLPGISHGSRPLTYIGS